MTKFLLPNKLKLASLPTPIQFMPWLSKMASQNRPIRVWMKRDDLNHGPAAGNKIRKLEYIFQDALQKKATKILTCGAMQSNHARSTAILAKQLGLDCELFLYSISETYPIDPTRHQGNMLLNNLLGAKVHFISKAEYLKINELLLNRAHEIKNNNEGVPYIIPVGGSSAVGVMGYIEAYQEIITQLKDKKQNLPDKLDSIVVANGSGGTHAGLLVGQYLLEIEDGIYSENQPKICSFNISPDLELSKNNVHNCCLSGIQHFRLPVSYMPGDIQVIPGYAGQSYGTASDEIYRFIADVSSREGIFLDPVYTGKALFGLLQELKDSNKSRFFGENVLFIHTGGFASLFAHTEKFSSTLGLK